jgi:hypothetical protein
MNRHHRLHDVKRHRCLMVKAMMERYNQTCFRLTLLYLFEKEAFDTVIITERLTYLLIVNWVIIVRYLLNFRLRCFLRAVYHCIWIVRYCY